jgi:hypothetical protein
LEEKETSIPFNIDRIISPKFFDEFLDSLMLAETTLIDMSIRPFQVEQLQSSHFKIPIIKEIQNTEESILNYVMRHTSATSINDISTVDRLKLKNIWDNEKVLKAKKFLFPSPEVVITAPRPPEPNSFLDDPSNSTISSDCIDETFWGDFLVPLNKQPCMEDAFQDECFVDVGGNVVEMISGRKPYLFARCSRTASFKRKFEQQKI